MPERTIDNIKTGLESTGDTTRGTTMGTINQPFKSNPNNKIAKQSVKDNYSGTEKGPQGRLPDPQADSILGRQMRAFGHKIDRSDQKIPGRPVEAAQNYDEAPPGQPGPDYSSRPRPAFTRGASVMDQTAITSAAPTPAGEIPNPMSFGLAKSISRQRESHLPDLDVRDGDVYTSEGFRTQPDEEISGVDEFGPELSRQETERGTRGTDNWEG